MLFTKFFVPVLAIFGVASTVLGSPVAAPEPVAVAETRSEIEARQLPDLTGILTQLENTIGPILSQIGTAAFF
ncbi:hypothetical protein C8Q75DRAFT_758638 [Abortiporus biennis]|nr:hypothetical protein C8Q75DRAFT_758638 [Abortiporus biennis]